MVQPTRPHGRGGAVRQWELADHGKDAGEVRIGREPLGDAPRALGRPHRPLVAGLQNHVGDPDRLPVPRAGEPERKALAERVVAEVAHRKEGGVRHHAYRGRGAPTLAGEKGQDLPLAPVVAHRGCLDGKGHVEPRERDVGDAERRRAHLHHPGDDEQQVDAHARARRERASADAGQNGDDRQKREGVAQILVLQQLHEPERRHDRREQKPVAPPRRHAESEDEEHNGDEPELGRKPSRVERERGGGQRVGVARLCGLPEPAARDLG